MKTDTKRRHPAGGDTSTVTVVVPCYEQAHFLAECLQSVRAQTLGDWSAIVVDDGSPDGVDIARAIEQLGDARLRLVRHAANRGRAAARNTGIREAETEFVLLLDADDRLPPNALEDLMEEVRKDRSLDCVYGDMQLFACADRVVSFPGPTVGEPALHGDQVWPCAGSLVRRSLWERVGGFDEADALRRQREDHEFWIRAHEAGCRANRLSGRGSRPTYERRVVHASAPDRPGDDVAAQYVYDKHRALFDAAGVARSFLAAGMAQSARAAYTAGDRRRAFELTWRAWRQEPSRAGLKSCLRTLLPAPTNRAIDEGAIRRAIPFAGYPLRGALRYRPFFVIGMGRSGNTLLRRILTSHSALHVPPESVVLGPTIRKFQRLGRRLNWPDLVSMVMAQFEFHPEFELFELDLAPLVDRLSRAPVSERNLAALFDAVFRRHAETHGRPGARWGDKSPMNSLEDALQDGDEPRALGAGVPQTLERLLEVFPDAQFLHIHRDGCDVVHSALRSGFFDDVETAAMRWLHVESQTRRFAAQHANCAFSVSYEELVERPEEVIRAVCAFLEVEYEPGMLSSDTETGRLGDVPARFWHDQVAQPITAENVGKARRLFSSAQREELQRLIGPQLEEWGYPAATAAEPQ